MWNCFSLKRGVKCLFVSSKKTKKHHRISIQYLAKWCKMHWKQSGISQRIFPSLRIPRISDHLELPKLVAYHSTHWTLRRAIEILPNHTCWLVTKRPACHVPYVIIHTVKDHFCNKFQLSFGDKEQQAVSNYPIACCCFGVITYGTMIYIYILVLSVRCSIHERSSTSSFKYLVLKCFLPTNQTSYTLTLHPFKMPPIEIPGSRRSWIFQLFGVDPKNSGVFNGKSTEINGWKPTKIEIWFR